MRIKSLYYSAFFIIALLANINLLHSQEIDDGVLISSPNGITNARTGALGISYMGIVDDISAAVYNPAGLALLPKKEFTIGLNFKTNSVTANQFNTPTSVTNNNFTFNNIGLVMPLNYYSGGGNRRLAFSMMYYRENDFNREHQTDWFNSNSSLISYYSKTKPEILYHLFLSPEWNKSLTPVINDLQQQSTVTQKGSINNLSFALGGDVSSNIALGGSLIFKWGSMSYTRNYLEYDINNKYSVFDKEKYTNLDFSKFSTNEYIDRSLFGVSANIGMIVKMGDFVRFSGAVKLPTLYYAEFSDDFEASAVFDNGEKPNSFTYSDTALTYTLFTPAVYSMGMSFYTNGLTITTGLEYSDLSSMRYNDNVYYEFFSNYLDEQNKLIRTQLTGQLTWGIGAEYTLTNFALPIIVRASYNSVTTPYKNDIDGADKKIIGFGAGINVDKGVRIDLGCRYTNYNEYVALYARDIDSRYKLTNNPIDFALNISYRFQ